MGPLKRKKRESIYQCLAWPKKPVKYLNNFFPYAQAQNKWSKELLERRSHSYSLFIELENKWQTRRSIPFILTASALKFEVDMVDPNKQDLQPAKSQEQLKFRTAAIYHKVPSVCASMAKFKSILTTPYRNILYNLHKSPKTEKIVWENGHISNSRKI